MMIPTLIITLLLGVGVIVLIFALWKGSGVKEWMARVRFRNFLSALSRMTHNKALEEDTRNAQSVQESLVLEALRRNRNTEYGQKHNFKDLSDVSSFQKVHPLTQYSDYKDYIERTKEGEENVLLQGRPHTLISTVGTSGNPSLVPVSVQSTQDYFLQGTAVYLEVIHSHFPGALEKIAKFTLPPNDRHSEAGIPITSYPLVCSSAILEQIYTSPVPLHTTIPYHETLYTQLLFTLKDPKLCVLQANYSWLLRQVFIILEEQWESLVTDIQRGRLNPEFRLPLNIRKQIEDALVPDAVRAEELRNQFRKGFLGIARGVWPSLQLVIAVESGGSDLDRQILKDTVCQGVPLYSPIYCAAEDMECFLCATNRNFWAPCNQLVRASLYPTFIFSHVPSYCPYTINECHI